jgi:hypothetical protein
MSRGSGPSRHHRGVTVEPSDERRHTGIAETWRFDLADPAAGLGVLVRLAYRPAERVAWWWVGLVGAGPPLVALRAHDVPIPARGTEIRTDGLWASLRCETPFVHWSVGLECFAVAYDDPWEALSGERGDVVPLGLDLEWEADGTPLPRPDGNGYGQWCTVSGEVLLGDDRIDVVGGGHREHAWGPAADVPASSVRLRTTGGGVWGADGWVVPAGRDVPDVTELSPCPIAVPQRPWVETLCRVEGGGGWVAGPARRSALD